MQEPFAAFCGLGRPVLGQGHDERAQHARGVHHLVLRVARVNVRAGHRDECRVGAERLGLERPQARSVNRVGDIGRKGLDVEVLRAASDLLVGREPDADRAVEARRVFPPLPERLEDDGHAGLVVRPEQRGAVGGDNRQPLAPGERGFFRHTDHLGGVPGQHDVPAVVVAVHLGIHVGAADAEVRVDVRDEANRRHPAVRRVGGRDVRRQRRHHVAPLVHGRVGQARGLEVVHQHAQQILLLLRGRIRRRRVGRLGVDFRVADEAIEKRLVLAHEVLGAVM